MSQIQFDNSATALREFAFTMAAALVGIFCLLLPWIFGRSIPHWPIVIAAILLLQAVIFPASLIPVRFIWMRVGGIIGWINTRIILGVLFFVVLTPLGFIQRHQKKLNYKIGFEPVLETYKIYRTQPLTAKDLENPF